MSKTILLLTTALVASGAAATAAPIFPAHLPNGVQLSREADGQLVARSNAPVGQAAFQDPFVTPSGISNLWSKEKAAPFIPYFGTVVGCFSFNDTCYSDGIAFTPSSSATSKSVTLGLMAEAPSAYTYNVDVSIYSDAGGIPGSALATTTVSAPTVFGTCCSPVTAKLKVQLSAGTQYWVVAAPHSSTDLVAWGFEDEEFTTTPTSAQNYGSGWNVFNTYEAPGYLVK
jgi:hypothetical protein